MHGSRSALPRVNLGNPPFRTYWVIIPKFGKKKHETEDGNRVYARPRKGTCELEEGIKLMRREYFVTEPNLQFCRTWKTIPYICFKWKAHMHRSISETADLGTIAATDCESIQMAPLVFFVVCSVVDVWKSLRFCTACLRIKTFRPLYCIGGNFSL